MLNQRRFQKRNAAGGRRAAASRVASADCYDYIGGSRLAGQDNRDAAYKPPIRWFHLMPPRGMPRNLKRVTLANMRAADLLRQRFKIILAPYRAPVDEADDEQCRASTRWRVPWQ